MHRLCVSQTTIKMHAATRQRLTNNKTTHHKQNRQNEQTLTDFGQAVSQNVRLGQHTTPPPHTGTKVAASNSTDGSKLVISSSPPLSVFLSLPSSEDSAVPHFQKSYRRTKFKTHNPFCHPLPFLSVCVLKKY